MLYRGDVQKKKKNGRVITIKQINDEFNMAIFIIHPSVTVYFVRNMLNMLKVMREIINPMKLLVM